MKAENNNIDIDYEGLAKWSFHYVEGLGVVLGGTCIAGSLGQYLGTGRFTGLIPNVPPKGVAVVCAGLLIDMAVRKYTGRGLIERMVDNTAKIIDGFYTLYNKIRKT
jgi:hypothetical protein